MFVFKAVKFKTIKEKKKTKKKSNQERREIKGMALQHVVFTAGKWLICIMYTGF